MNSRVFPKAGHEGKVCLVSSTTPCLSALCPLGEPILSGSFGGDSPVQAISRNANQRVCFLILCTWSCAKLSSYE